MRTRRTSGAGLGGRYRLDAIVAQGRVATVFRAWDRALRRPVAVKWVRADIAPSHYPRWRADADELRRLAHPGLIRERDHGTEDGRPFVVMDLVAPSTLRAVCAATPLTPAAVADVGQQLAETLRHLHDNEVVHRAVCADRVLVDVAALGDCRVWLDCGPWVPDDSPSLRHRAPELRHGEEASVCGDVWSLGMVILDCLAGWTADDAALQTGARMSGSDLPQPWQVLLPMMLDPRPEHRPTAGQVAVIVGAARLRATAWKNPPPVLSPQTVHPVPWSRPRGALIGRLGMRSTAITMVTALTAIVLLVVGVRIVRAAEGSVSRVDAGSSVRTGPMMPSLVGTTTGAQVRAVAVGSVAASPGPVATPIIRTVAAVTTLGPRHTEPTGRPASAGPGGPGCGHAHGRGRQHPKPAHPKAAHPKAAHPKPAHPKPAHGQV